MPHAQRVFLEDLERARNRKLPVLQGPLSLIGSKCPEEQEWQQAQRPEYCHAPVRVVGASVSGAPWRSGYEVGVPATDMRVRSTGCMACFAYIDATDTMLVEEQKGRALPAERPLDCIQSRCEGFVERKVPIEPVFEVVENHELSRSEKERDAVSSFETGDLCRAHNAPDTSHRSGKPWGVKTFVSLFPVGRLIAVDRISNVKREPLPARGMLSCFPTFPDRRQVNFPSLAALATSIHHGCTVTPGGAKTSGSRCRVRFTDRDRTPRGSSR